MKTLDADARRGRALRTRFRREAVAAAAVAHPNIVATYDTGEDDGIAYIVMELVDGATLRQLIDDARPARPSREAAASRPRSPTRSTPRTARGLVHRDVKPAQRARPADGRVKVTDFGIAKADRRRRPRPAPAPSWAPRATSRPSRSNGHAADARADVYALGLVLYEMLCGQPPFGADTDIATAIARLTTSAPSVRTDRPDAPAALDDIVHRCLRAAT